MRLWTAWLKVMYITLFQIYHATLLYFQNYSATLRTQSLSCQKRNLKIALWTKIVSLNNCKRNFLFYFLIKNELEKKKNNVIAMWSRLIWCGHVLFQKEFVCSPPTFCWYADWKMIFLFIDVQYLNNYRYPNNLIIFLMKNYVQILKKIFWFSFFSTVSWENKQTVFKGSIKHVVNLN